MHYQLARLHVNFFRPVEQLVTKHREGARVHRGYDRAQTPYQRLCAPASCPPTNVTSSRPSTSASTPLQLRRGFTQIGEFSFIFIQVARGAGHVGADVYNTTLAASLLTILINAALVRWIPDLIREWRLGQPAERAAGDPGAQPGHVVLCGFGRVGSAIAEAIETFDVRYVVIEIDPDIVRGLRRRGISCLFGDAAHRRRLEAAGAAQAALVVVALPDAERVHLAVRHVRAVNAGFPVLARAHVAVAHERLRAAGATEVIQPEMEAAATVIRHALRSLALPRDRVLEYLGRFREALQETPARGAEEAGLPRLRELVVEMGALANQSLGEVGVRERFGVTVLGLARADGEVVHHPGAETILRAEDRVRVFGLPEQIAGFAAALRESG